MSRKAEAGEGTEEPSPCPALAP